MKDLIKIEPIAVKDKNDVVKALTILERIGIEIMSEEQKKTYLADSTKNVDNNFMIQEDDGGFRIQSHYLGFGISLKSLEKQVDNIIKKYPNICEKLKEIENKKKELTKEIEEKKKKLTEEVDNMNVKFKGSKKSLPIIHLKENK
jgi:predicted nuclease with TOPRIM domain